MPQESSGRRSIRIQGFDYSQPGYYHVVIGTYQSKWFFGNVVDGEMRLNRAGSLAQEMWLSLPSRFACVTLDQYVIMPNHVHGIVVINALPHNPKIANMPAKFQPYWQQQEQNKLSIPDTIELSEIVRTFKAATTYHIRRKGGKSDFAWHSGYFERIIANSEQSLYNAQLYILNNPVKWQLSHQGWEAAGFKWAKVTPKSEPQ
jgi:REP element-mobilizing transposase RayT